MVNMHTGFKRKDIFQRGQLGSKDYVYQGTNTSPYAGHPSCAPSFNTSYTTLAVLAGGLCVLLGAYAASAQTNNSGKEEVPLEPVLKNISDNNSDSYIKEAALSGTKAISAQGAKQTEYGLKGTEEAYIEALFKTVEDKKITLEEVRELSIILGEYIEDLKDPRYQKDLSSVELKANETRLDIATRIEKEIFIGYPGLFQNVSSPTRLQGTYDMEVELRKLHNEAFEEILKSYESGIKAQVPEAALGMEYDDFFKEDDYTLRDVYTIYTLFRPKATIGGEREVNIRVSEEVQRKLKAYITESEAYGKEMRERGMLEGGNKTVGEHKLNYMHSGLFSYYDPSDKSVGREVDEAVTKEFIRFNNLTDESEPELSMEDLNHRVYPIGNVPTSPWDYMALSLVLSYGRAILSAKYCKREFDDFDWWGPIFNNFAGVLIDGCHPAIYPIRTFFGGSVWMDVLFKNNRKETAEYKRRRYGY